MKKANPFLAAIVDTPEDDTPRLIFADWLEEHGESERADFIRTQIKIAQLAEDDPVREELELREYDLLVQHGDAWREELPSFARKECIFRRGFVDEITCKAAAFVKGARDLYHVAPVRRARLTYPVQGGSPDIDTSDLASCPFLGRLDFLGLSGYSHGQAAVGDRGVRTLLASEHLAKLDSLDLSGNNLTASAMQALATSPNVAGLRWLNVTGSPHNATYNQIGNAGAVALASSPYLANLRELILDGNQIDAAGLAALARSSHLRKLTALEVNENPLGPTGGQVLADSPLLPHLTRLGVGETNTNIVPLLASPGLKSLKSVNLANYSFDSDPIRSFFQGSAGQGLTHLICDRCGIGEAELNMLGSLHLQSLRMWGNGLSAELVRLLVSLPVCTGLQTLNLAMNEVGDAGASALAESPHLDRLLHLNLFANQIGSPGAQALAASPHLARLRRLILFSNKIGDVGARALIASPHLKLLRLVDLGSNSYKKPCKEELQQHFRFRVNLSNDGRERFS